MKIENLNYSPVNRFEISLTDFKLLLAEIIFVNGNYIYANTIKIVFEN